VTSTEGLMTIASPLDFPATVERLEKNIASHGMTVMARIDHAKGAEAAGLSLPPTLVLIFGNAKAGTPWAGWRNDMRCLRRFCRSSRR
jgi:uncharacterized protein (DUF302 family)